MSAIRGLPDLAPIVSTRVDRPGKDADDPAAIRKAAVSMEAFLLDQVLKTVREGDRTGAIDGGFAGGTFREMLDSALSQKMAERGVLGLAPLIEARMGGDPERVPGLAPPHRALAAPATPGGAAKVDSAPQGFPGAVDPSLRRP